MLLPETSFEVSLCKPFQEQHISATETEQKLFVQCTYSFDVNYTSWTSRGPWGSRQARHALVKESEVRKILHRSFYMQYNWA